MSVFDFLKPEVTHGHDQIFGFSFSSNGVDWPAENGAAVPLLPRNASAACGSLWTSRARTPLSLIDEGDGTLHHVLHWLRRGRVQHGRCLVRELGV